MPDLKISALDPAGALDGNETVPVIQLGANKRTTVSAIVGKQHAHAISDVTNLQTTLDGKSATSHVHDDRYYTEAESDIYLANKANTSHTHAQADVTNLATDLSNKQPLDADLTTIAGLTPTTDNFMVATASAWASRTPAQARSQLGLGTLATQSGTFSGTSSGTNTGDQTLSDATITTTDITTNNFTTAKHGFVPKGTNVGNFLKDDGTWATPAGGGGGVTDHTLLTNIGTNTHAQIDTHIANVANPHAVTKTQVGLSSVDNTSDAGKPVSTAQQTALNLKANLASPTFTGTVAGITAAMVGAPSGSGSSSGTNTGDNATNTQYSGLVTNANHTGDATGSTALTLATVNANVGSFTAANITVNAKGLVTAASNGSGGAAYKDENYYKNVGTTSYERWYQAGRVNGVAATTASYSVGVIRAIPVVWGKDAVLDRLAINVTVLAASGVGRVGIYNNTSDTNLYPSSLVVDGGEILTATTGIKSATISQALTLGNLYWFVVSLGVAAPTLGALSVGSIGSLLGTDNTAIGTMGTFIQVSSAYGALPGTFPSSATVSAGGAPIIAYRVAS